MIILYRFLFPSKKQLMLLLMMICLLCAFLLLIDFNQSSVTRIYERDYEQTVFLTLSHQMLLMMFPLMGLVIAFDHDQPYLKPLIAYKGRFYVCFYQVVLYVVLVVLMGSALMFGHHLMRLYFFKIETGFMGAIQFFLSMAIDTLILMMLFMMTSTYHQKIKAFVILMCYTIGLMILSDLESVLCYYLCPIGYYGIALLNHALWYKATYVLLLTYGVFLHKMYETITSG